MNIVTPAPAPAVLRGLPAGILMLTTRPRRDRVLVAHQGCWLEHRAAAGPAARALQVVQEAGIAAAATYAPGQEQQSWAALLFSAHLAGHRSARAIKPVPCLTSAARPEPVPGGIVRIPHLAGFASAGGRVSDRVIWELMTAADAMAWLGGPLPDQGWFEERLPSLLTLRKAFREGTLPDQPSCTLLRAKITGPGYLSIRHAYQNPALIADAIMATGSGQDPGEILED